MSLFRATFTLIAIIGVILVIIVNPGLNNHYGYYTKSNLSFSLSETITTASEPFYYFTGLSFIFLLHVGVDEDVCTAVTHMHDF